MDKKKRYVAPMAIVVAMESTFILAASEGTDKYKINGKSDTETQLEYGGEGGGSLYDPD